MSARAARGGSPWRALAWLCLVLAIPLRLAFFAGYGLGDDPNESFSLIDFAHHLRFNPGNFMYYRVIKVQPSARGAVRVQPPRAAVADDGRR